MMYMRVLQIGGFGRFQWLHVTLISLPGLLMASQNLLNNFTAGMPMHHCTPSANHSVPSRYNLSAVQVCLLICLPACLSAHLSVHLSVCLSVCASSSECFGCCLTEEPDWLVCGNGGT